MQENELLVKMILDAWNSQLGRTDKLFAELSDAQLEQEVAPGRNTGVYLLGHLAAVHDGMLPLLGFGEKEYPEMEAVFIRNPDKAGLPKPSIQELRARWKAANERLAGHFAKLNAAEWFQKHTAVSAEDFVKEPHRNRLNVLLSRTMHIGSHHSQLVFLKK